MFLLRGSCYMSHAYSRLLYDICQANVPSVKIWSTFHRWPVFLQQWHPDSKIAAEAKRFTQRKITEANFSGEVTAVCVKKTTETSSDARRPYLYLHLYLYSPALQQEAVAGMNQPGSSTDRREVSVVDVDGQNLAVAVAAALEAEAGHAASTTSNQKVFAKSHEWNSLKSILRLKATDEMTTSVLLFWVWAAWGAAGWQSITFQISTVFFLICDAPGASLLRGLQGWGLHLRRWRQKGPADGPPQCMFCDVDRLNQAFLQATCLVLPYMIFTCGRCYARWPLFTFWIPSTTEGL